MTVKVMKRAEGLHRAYSVLRTGDISTAGDKVTIKGIATTPSVDSYGDIVVPGGAEYKTPMPLLWQHDSTMPVGRVTFAKAVGDEMPFEAELPIIAEAGRLKDRVDEAIHSLKYALVSAVSIGFRAIEWEHIKGGGIRFDRWKWVELSLVTIGANEDAVISAVKSADKLMPQRGRGVKLIK